jgi:hypothetical protein
LALSPRTARRALPDRSPPATLAAATARACLPHPLRSAAPGLGEVASLRSQVAFASKEKSALQAILEGKALPLAQQLSRGLADALEGAGGAAGAISAHRGGDGDGDGGGAERLQRQVAALQRLLAATVAAMARAGPMPTGSSGGAVSAGGSQA